MLEKAGKFFYPSVECGPLSNDKFKKIFKGFKFNNFERNFKETVEFFEN